MPPLRQVCEDVDARSKCNKCGHGDGGWSCSKSPCLQGVGMTTLLDMRGISKAFVGVKALSDVNFTVRQGEIHALVGENGAGKSTLMKVLSGVYPSGSYDGSIVYDGEERHFRDINDSEALGIIIIHQELALIPLLSIPILVTSVSGASLSPTFARSSCWRKWGSMRRRTRWLPISGSRAAGSTRVPDE